MVLGLGLTDERESKLWEVERTAFQTVETASVKALGQKQIGSFWGTKGKVIWWEHRDKGQNDMISGWEVGRGQIMQGPITFGKCLVFQYSGNQWSELNKEITSQFTALKKSLSLLCEAWTEEIKLESWKLISRDSYTSPVRKRVWWKWRKINEFKWAYKITKI